ncbi:MAG: glycosyltransferase family 39 protein [Saprospiraceae bacterium]|nr:glycosyltransferase family 39 protein [Saprospiraceae bacterium]
MKTKKTTKAQSHSVAEPAVVKPLSSTPYWVAFGILALLVAYYRSKLLGMPFERDEAEYAYFGKLILDGIVPYKEAYNMKLPGIYYMYAFIMAIFGKTFYGVHLGALIMNLGTMTALYYAVSKLFSRDAGIITAVFFGIMSLGYGLLGFAAHATQFAVFFMAIGLVFFAKHDEHSSMLNAFLTGFFIGLSFLMKQQAVYYILGIGLLFLVFQYLNQKGNWGNIAKYVGLFSVGVFVPYILVCLVMMASGIFDKFWFWTVQYASQYATGLSWDSGKELLSMTFKPIWTEYKAIFIMSIMGLVALIAGKYTLKQKIFGVVFYIFAFLATTPGFFFRQHYFIVYLPAVALWAGIFVDFIGGFIARATSMPVLRLALTFLIGFATIFSITSANKGYYSTKNPVQLCKNIYSVNPFVESVEIAKYIKENSKPEDKIAILGSEPQIAFYADRKSASGHIYTYGLMEEQPYNLRMQEEMISEIEQAKPLYMVYANIAMSWLPKPNSPKKIFEWYNTYSAANYDLVGICDLPTNGPAVYYWGADALTKRPANENYVFILKRKPNK